MTCSTKLKKEQTEVQTDNVEEDDVNNERPKWSEVRLFIVILTVALFCNTSSQQVVEAYIYEYSRCSKTIALDSESAATVVNIFWVTSTIARGTAIIISRITSPKTYIIFDYILAIGALGMLLITPLISHVYLVVAVIAFGFRTRVQHFAIFKITSRILRILMEHIEMKNSSESKLQTDSIYFIRIVNFQEVIAETTFFQKSKKA